MTESRRRRMRFRPEFRRLVESEMAYQSTKDLEDQMKALTPEQVNAAIRKYINPEKLIIVTAGDFK